MKKSKVKKPWEPTAGSHVRPWQEWKKLFPTAKEEDVEQKEDLEELEVIKE
jgi:hypothetical protein